jgi:hypothetical protein
MAKKHSKSSTHRLTPLGWKEWVGLPDLNIPKIKAKVDTGARTSALHAYFVEPYHKGADLWVRFGIHPNQGDTDTELICSAPVLDKRNVTDSGGHAEQRYVIATTILVGQLPRKVEITLTNRDAMKFRMLLGRTGLNGIFCVNPEAAYLAGEPNDLLT